MNDTEKYKMIFAERLVSLRKEKGIKQESLVEQLNASTQTISKWENGRSSEPSLSQLCTLAELFDVSLDYLVGMSDERQIKNSEMIKSEIIEIVKEYADRTPYNNDSPTPNSPLFSNQLADLIINDLNKMNNNILK